MINEFGLLHFSSFRIATLRSEDDIYKLLHVFSLDTCTISLQPDWMLRFLCCVTKIKNQKFLPVHKSKIVWLRHFNCCQDVKHVLYRMNNNVIIPQTYKSIYIPEISMYFHVDPGSSLSTDPEITHENYDKIRIYFIKMLIYQSRVYQDTFFKNWWFSRCLAYKWNYFLCFWNNQISVIKPECNSFKLFNSERKV